MFSAREIKFLPVFLPFDEVRSETGKGSYCLYHGNLSVVENEKAALWLLENVFAETRIPFIIAGKNPSDHLKNKISQSKNVELKANPSQSEMQQLIKKAHIHLLPSLNVTGIKIKLLNALFNGRFILTNKASVNGTGLESLCHLAETGKEYLKKINEMFDLSFSQNEIDNRKNILAKIYDNKENVRQLIKWL